MSTTFWCPDAPTKTVAPYADEPDYLEEVSELPEVSVSGSGTTQLLTAVGLAYEEYGTLEVAELPGLLAKLETAIAGANLGAKLEERIGSPGLNTQKYRRLSAFRSLLVAAQAAGYRVSWG